MMVIPSAAGLSGSRFKLAGPAWTGRRFISTSSVVATEDWATRCVMVLPSRRRTGVMAIATQRAVATGRRHAAAEASRAVLSGFWTTRL
jgi:hypothetical protein